MEKEVIGEKLYAKQAIAIGVDLYKSESIEKGITQALEFLGGKVHLLFNNAGAPGMPPQTCENTKLEDFNKVMALNVTAPFLVAKYCLPGLKKAKVKTPPYTPTPTHTVQTARPLFLRFFLHFCTDFPPLSENMHREIFTSLFFTFH